MADKGRRIYKTKEGLEFFEFSPRPCQEQLDYELAEARNSAQQFINYLRERCPHIFTARKKAGTKAPT